MHKINIFPWLRLLAICLVVASCKVPSVVQKTANKSMPITYAGSHDTTQIAVVRWRSFFTDPCLVHLIDTALKNNQELQITLQELEIAKNDIGLRQGQLLPSVGAKIGSGLEKVGRYTSQGAGDASTEIEPGKEMPDPLADYTTVAYANWELDVWKKLHHAKKAAVNRYLASVEGKNFVLTNLIAEVADAYYELRALDSQLALVKQNITLQKNALDMMRVQKEATRVTELAVQKFEAEVLNSQSMEYVIRQQMTETENKINLLLGRFPQAISRDTTSLLETVPAIVHAGIPAQLLANRPDIKEAELALIAAKLDVKVARAEFYPSLSISAAIGFQAFKPSYLVKFPESMLYSIAGDLAGPLINKKAIKAEFYNANAHQLQVMYDYERTILHAYLEVSTQLAKIDNLDKHYALQSKEVDALNRSIAISNDLFKSARADYFEVLMTQRDALTTKLELVETKKEQLQAVTHLYRDLGGGWK